MEVRYRQHLGGACSKPFIASVGLTLRAMPISTRVKRDGVMTTLRTAVFVSAERSGAAVLNSTKNANVLPLNQRRLFSIKSLPTWRRISATSKGGRFIF